MKSCILLSAALSAILATGPMRAAEGLFHEPALLPLEAFVPSVAIGDVTGDGRNDVVLGTDSCQPDCGILVLPQTPLGALGSPVRYPAPPGMSLVVGDLNGDDRGDVLVAGIEVGFLSQGPGGGLRPEVQLPGFRDAVYVASGDLNGDGRMDVVSIPLPGEAPAELVIDVHRQSAEGQLVRTSQSFGPIEWCEFCPVQVEDLDGDALLDLLILDDHGRLLLFYQQPNGRFTRRQIDGVAAGYHFRLPVVGNFDSDPLPEILVAGSALDPGFQPPFRLVKIDQTAPGVWKVGKAEVLESPFLQLEAADLNGDGLDDLVGITVGGLGVQTARILLQGPVGEFALSEAHELPFGNYQSHQTLDIGDLNHDGLPDVAIADDNFGLITLIQKGSGEPAPPPELFSPAVPDFGFTVRIGSGSATPALAGTLEPACIPETVCVSGALAGRSEVFLRVVGPKPNGRLWPTLVKFTTSRVDVWVHQISTGEVRHYRLAGASPGKDELPGLFDRAGFEPTALSGVPVVEPAAGTAPPPPEQIFASPHFPDYRFRARITSGGKTQSVRMEPGCIEETLCLSGAIPGRSELFIRIVGPKPNGRMWPTIVKFTTSTVEVWIEQISTGESRYYQIEGAAPGKDDLTGLFDRNGFKR
jgi:hypothetical protein